MADSENPPIETDPDEPAPIVFVPAASTELEPAPVEPAEGVEPGAAATTPAHPGRARRVAIVGLRVVAGAVGLVAAAAIIAAVGLVPLHSRDAATPGVLVTPVPADQVRLCAGALLRLGDSTGQNASTASAIAAPSVRDGGIGATLTRSPLAASDAGSGGSSAAPAQLTIPPAAGATLSGAQSQVAEDDEFSGFAAASCAEPSGSIWLVGGSTSTGRTTILTLANPSPVDATIALTILGPDGAVSAPGMTGIVVKAGQQRVIPLAGFAPDIASPVVHIVARGGQVTGYLQQSIVRGLDAGGVDIIGAGADPAAKLVIPGVRVVNSIGVNRALALPDWDDVAAAVRVAVPGTVPAKVAVSLIPADATSGGISFQMDVAAGHVTELPLDSAEQGESATVAIPDGDYTVVLASDQPIVGGVRVSTVVDSPGADATSTSDTTAPASDFAWYGSAPALIGDTAVSIAPGAAPVLAATNPTAAAITVTLKAQGGTDASLAVPAGGSASVPVDTGTTYLLTGGTGLVATISYAGPGQLAAYPVASARPVSGPITVHP
jgi:hypothetical protein